MIYDLLYCPGCGHCHPRKEDLLVLPCGYEMKHTVKMTLETVGPYERLIIKLGSTSRIEALIWDGVVEYKPKNCKNTEVVAMWQFLEAIAERKATLPQAVMARRDIR